MAVRNSQDATENTLEVNLNEIFVGHRRLRYIYQYEQNIVGKEFDEAKKCRPLFLGCDVLDECGISSGNLPRFHAKHARRGLATKLNFQSGVRIVGIHGTSRGVWFYSIQGVFKIAFEHYIREQQRDCLCKLREIWERQILDSVLIAEIDVVFENSIRDDESSCVLKTKLNTKEVELTSSTITSVDQLVARIEKAIDSYASEKSEMLPYEIKMLKVYLTYMVKDKDWNCILDRTMRLVNNCLQILPALSSEMEKLRSQRDSDESDSTKCSPKPQREDCVGNPNHTSIEYSDVFAKEAVITEVASWLGKEFSRYHDKIIEKVTLFKQSNMSSIGSLPSAKNFIADVFPHPMLVFLCNWLRTPLSWGFSSADDVEPDENRTYLFPVIQLILELANESLVSGVSHVLYSQLVQSDRVQ